MGFRDLAVSNPIGGIYTTILKSGVETALFPTDSCVGTEKKEPCTHCWWICEEFRCTSQWYFMGVCMIITRRETESGYGSK